MDVIKNERQFKTSKAQAALLRETLNSITTTEDDSEISPHLVELEIRALESQLFQIQTEIDEYVELTQRPPAKIEVASLELLPAALIKARIAARMTHRDLAELLGLQEQQIQRYEATDYAKASLSRLIEIAAALGVNIRQELDLVAQNEMPRILERVQRAGIDRRLLERRLLFGSRRPHDEPTRSAQQFLSDLRRIYGWSLKQLRSEEDLEPDVLPQLAASFKLPANRAERSVTAYAVYAHYISKQIASAIDVDFRPPPSDWSSFRSLIAGYGELTLRNLATFAWDSGIAVIPLQDHVAMHGAFWRFENSAAIVIKQGMRTTSRWLFDLLHELYHAATEEVGVIDAADSGASDSEAMANQFAAEVLLRGASEKLVARAVERAQGELRFLKRSAQEVAAEADVPVGVFANALAWRLAPRHDWWGVAANLQKGEPDPWEIVRDVLLENAPLERLSRVDQRLVMAALRESGDALDVQY